MRLSDNRLCKQCFTPLKRGLAIEQTLTSGMPDFPGDAAKGIKGITLSPGGSGKLIDCMKCPDCGWSMTGARGLVELEVTPWFNGDIAPCRPGLYQRRLPYKAVLMHLYLWKGHEWWYPSSQRPFRSGFQVDPKSMLWRGLTKKL